MKAVILAVGLGTRISYESINWNIAHSTAKYHLADF